MRGIASGGWLVVALSCALLPSQAPAADLNVTLLSKSRQITLNQFPTEGPWTYLSPTKPILLEVKQADRLRFRFRPIQKRDQPLSTALYIDIAGKRKKLTIESRPTDFSVSTADSSSHWVYGEEAVFSLEVTGGSRLRFVLPKGVAGGVLSWRSEIRSSGVANNPPPETAEKKYTASLSFGYLYGFGDVKTPNMDLSIGYRLPIPPTHTGDIDVVLTGGWYMGSELEQQDDELLGPLDKRWRLMAVPLFLGTRYALPFPTLTLFGGVGMEYVFAFFTQHVDSELGRIGPETRRSGGAAGWRSFAGISLSVGAGDLQFLVKYSGANIKNSLSDVVGNLGGLGVMLGYSLDL